MSIVLFFVVLIVLAAIFVRLNLTLYHWLPLASGVLLVTTMLGWTQWLLSLLTIVGMAAVYLLLYWLPDARRRFVSKPLLRMVRKILPPISPTEQQAIDAGTVWWDAELFAGNPDWKKLFAVTKQSLTEEEQAFLSGPVEEVCAICDDWEITHELNDLPQEVWTYLKQHGFFGLNAAKEYGGHGFSTYAQSTIIQKLASRSGTLGVTVMVPNSLGPAELLYHYGTDEQKNFYLRRLVKGEEVPCFGLTGLWAGSDADGMLDGGIACMGEYEGRQVLGFRVNWEKRYITLAPVATLIGLAFKAYDPQQLLGDQYELGITCALIPADTQGVEIGNRHLPLNAAFHNGPITGQDVFVPINWIIGEKDGVGIGWRMLMESLAAGRGISLPAASSGAAKISTRSSGAYAYIREQFGLSIGKFEGIQEVLARIGGLTYLLDAGRLLMLSALDRGEKPAVMSAIVKQQCTELSRIVVNDAMDLHGGKGICMGPSNYLARAYQQLPIGITVEGANILTRSLIIFGQGALRCHPWLLKEISAVGCQDEDECLDRFDQALVGHIKYSYGNKLRSFILGLSHGWLGKGYGRGLIRRYTRQVEQLSAAFAYLADISLILLGGGLKRKEMLSGRFADVLSKLYLVSAVLKRYADNGEQKDEAPLVHWACQYGLYNAQQSLDGILRNYPVAWLGMLLRLVIFPSGRYLKMPNDLLSQQVAQILQTQGSVRDRLTEHIYISKDDDDIMRSVEQALKLMKESELLRARMKKNGHIAAADQSWEDWLEGMRDNAVIDTREAELLRETRSLVSRVISVDDFDMAADMGRSRAAVDSDPAPRESDSRIPGEDNWDQKSPWKGNID